MPRLSTFHGIVVYMYIRDHGVPHVHAWHGGDRAVVDLATGHIVAGRSKPRETGLVRISIDIHRTELIAAWEHASVVSRPVQLSRCHDPALLNASRRRRRRPQTACDSSAL